MYYSLASSDSMAVPLSCLHHQEKLNPAARETGRVQKVRYGGAWHLILLQISALSILEPEGPLDATSREFHGRKDGVLDVKHILNTVLNCLLNRRRQLTCCTS